MKKKERYPEDIENFSMIITNVCNCEKLFDSGVNWLINEESLNNLIKFDF